MFEDVNYYAVLVAGLIATVYGYFWYAPIFFGRVWSAMNRFSKREKESIRKHIGGDYFYGLIIMCMLAMFVDLFFGIFGVTEMKDGLFFVFWLWLGLIAPIEFGEVIWERKPFDLFLINGANRLISLFIIAIVLIQWA
jgi:hypothetical protein